MKEEYSRANVETNFNEDYNRSKYFEEIFNTFLVTSSVTLLADNTILL